MKFEVGQRVYVKVPQIGINKDKFLVGEITEVYFNDLEVPMAGVVLDENTFNCRTIYIGQEKLNLMGKIDE